MRTRTVSVMATVAMAIGFQVSAFGQGAVTTPSGVTSTTAPTTSRPGTGFAVQDGIVYFVRNNRTIPVNQELIPRGQIMLADGRLAIDAPELDGYTLEEGVVYYTRGGVRQRIDTGMVPGGHIMTLTGDLATMPTGVIGFPGTQAITVPRAPAPATSSE